MRILFPIASDTHLLNRECIADAKKVSVGPRHKPAVGEKHLNMGSDVCSETILKETSVA